MQCPTCDTKLTDCLLGENPVEFCGVCRSYWLGNKELVPVLDYWLVNVKLAPRHQLVGRPPLSGFCPHCNTLVNQILLDKRTPPILECPTCAGVLVKEEDIPYLVRWWKSNKNMLKRGVFNPTKPEDFRLSLGAPVEGALFQYDDLNPARRLPVVVLALIFVCGFAFLVAPFLDGYKNLLLVPNQLFRIPLRSSYTVLTSMFLHGDVMHLFGNMYFLYLFGDNIEDRIGPAKFLVVYIALGIVAALGHCAYTTHPDMPTLGASGAISGIMGGYLYLYPNVKMRIFFWRLPLRATLELPVWIYLFVWWFIVLQLGGLAGSSASIAWWAHITGFISGYLLFFVMKKLDWL